MQSNRSSRTDLWPADLRSEESKCLLRLACPPRSTSRQDSLWQLCSASVSGRRRRSRRRLGGESPLHACRWGGRRKRMPDGLPQRGSLGQNPCYRKKAPPAEQERGFRTRRTTITKTSCGGARNLPQAVRDPTGPRCRARVSSCHREYPQNRRCTMSRPVLYRHCIPTCYRRY